MRLDRLNHIVDYVISKVGGDPMGQELKVLRGGADTEVVDVDTHHFGLLKNRSDLSGRFTLKRALQEIAQVSDLIVIE